MIQLRRSILRLWVLIGALFTLPVQADYIYEGIIAKSDGSPVATSVDLKLQIRGDGGSSCILYEENISGVLLESNGFVSTRFLSANSVRTASDPGLNEAMIFSNEAPILGSAGCSYNPAASSARNLFVTVTAGGQSEEFGPMAMVEVPRATVAKKLESVSTADLNQLLTGNSSLYMKTGSGGAAALPTNPAVPTSLPPGSIWFDSTTNQVKFHNGTAPVTLGAGGGGGGGISSVSGSGPISVANGSTSPSISMAPAGSGQAGYLTAADWALFNSKQNAGSYLSSLTAADVQTALGYTPLDRQFAVQKGGNSGSFMLGTTDSGSLSFLTSNQTRMRLDPAGLVGIGTTSPTAKLEVNGQLKITGGSPGAGKILQSDANGLASWATLGGSESTTVSNIGAAGTGVFKQLTGSSIELKKINAAGSAISIIDDTTNNEIDIDVNGELGALAGLATTGFVKRTGTGAYTAGAAVDLTSSDVAGALPISKGGTGQTSVLAALNILSPLSTKGDILAHDGTNNLRMPVGSNGQFLAANSSPSSGLEWRGIAAGDLPSFTPDRILATGGGGAIQTFTCSLNQVISFNASGVPACSNVNSLFAGFTNGGSSFAANAAIGTNDNFPLELRTNSTARMTVLPSGNVGIGTTTPAYLLDVNGAIAGSTIKVREMYFRDADSTNFIRLSSATNVTSDYALELPSAPGALGDVLGLTAVGVLSWVKTKAADLDGLISKPAENAFYVRSDGNDACDGKSNSPGTPPASCATQTIPGAMKRLPIIIREPITLYVNSTPAVGSTTVINKIFEDNGSLEINGGNNTYNASGLISGPAFVFMSRGITTSGPRVKLHNMPILANPTQPTILAMGDVTLSQLTISGASRPISMEFGYIQWAGTNTITLQDSSDSVGMQAGKGTIEIGDGSGTPSVSILLPIPSSSSNRAIGVSCFGCALRLRGIANLNITMNGSGAGQATGMSVGGGASIEVEASASSGIHVTNGTANSGLGLESEGSKFYVSSGDLHFDMYDGEGIRLNSGSKIYIQNSGVLRVGSGMSGAKLDQGSSIYSMGDALFNNRSNAGVGIELMGGSVLDVSVPSAKTFGLSNLASGTGVRASMGSQARFNGNGGAFTFTGLNPLIEATKGSELSMNGASGMGSFGSFFIKLDSNSYFKNTSHQATFTQSKLDPQCLPGMVASGPTGNRVCRDSAALSATTYDNQVTACVSAGKRLCRRNEIKRICVDVGSGAFFVEELMNPGNAFLVDCGAGGTTNSTGTTASLPAYCCLD